MYHKFKKTLLFSVVFISAMTTLKAQEAYFIDGFHGGIWGHYPKGYTQYILQLLEEHPDWKVNLEIEPDTWDRTQKIDFKSYDKLQKLFAENSANSRVEYVNPTYAQSYLFNTSGESMIRQFSYGIKKLKKHFPGINFYTYSAEEPCFTSALPQILKTFGIKYASLKNPNTCWGGYTRAHGGELVNWIGPDGTSIKTVPRYAFESLKSGSTWETIANGNSPDYINAAFNYGITKPIGMTLQDAGWKWGPWLKGNEYKPSYYTTWRNYFENIVNVSNITDWKLNQEDILVSLVWGSQVLQKLAQQVRKSENLIVQAEKMATFQKIENGEKYPEEKFDEAWQNLLLAQHHDCWIVPYNGKKGDTWADKVVTWTNKTNEVSKNVIFYEKENNSNYFKIYNTLGTSRTDLVEIILPNNFTSSEVTIYNFEGKEVTTQQSTENPNSLIFSATVPAFGYTIYQVKKKTLDNKSQKKQIQQNNSGEVIVESDLYKLVLDLNQGGSVKSLIAKTIDNKEFVDSSSDVKFNALQGKFYDQGGVKNNFNTKATLEILEDGFYRIKVAVKSEINGTPVIQTITLINGNPRIDFNLKIDWKENTGIGAYKETNFKETNLEKAFYDDKSKLLALFPLKLKNQKVFKNAPFDTMESNLDDTFFKSWDDIKNNIILNWVDITDGKQEYGCTLFTDHTTSYVHGKDFPLALNVQYSGTGLWGRHYTIEGPTEINYSLLPHRGNWIEANIPFFNEKINEPLQVITLDKKPKNLEKSLLKIEKKGWIISSFYDLNGSSFLRIFNANGDDKSGRLYFGFDVNKVSIVELNGVTDKKLKIIKGNHGSYVEFHMPQFAFKTLKILN